MTKSLQRLLIMLIFIFVSASAYLFLTKNDNRVLQISNPTSTPIQIQTTNIENIKSTVLTTNKNPTPNPSPRGGNDKNEPTSSSLTTPSPIRRGTEGGVNEQLIPAKFIIQNKEYSSEFKPGSSAYEAMNKLKDSGQISFSSKNFSGLGYFIEEINDIKNSPSTGFYWTLYINNEEAKVGVSGYILKPNDIITWKYVRK